MTKTDMNTTIENYRGEQFEVELYFTQEFKGRGGWNINCEVTFKSDKKIFRRYTTDTIFIDSISDMKSDDASYDEIQDAYYEKSFSSVEESVIDWCEEVIEAIEEDENE